MTPLRQLVYAMAVGATWLGAAALAVHLIGNSWPSLIAGVVGAVGANIHAGWFLWADHP